MNISKNGKLEIASYEGLMTKAYYDSVKVLTIGIGHTNVDNKVDMTLGKEYTIQQMIDLFNKDIQRYVDSVNKSLTVKISQSQFDALVSFQYNTGGFGRSTLKSRINSSGSAQSIFDAFLMWNKPKEIIGRRTNEANLYRYGKYTNKGTTVFRDVDNKGNILWKTAKNIDISKYFS